jgi:hypothetical protein
MNTLADIFQRELWTSEDINESSEVLSLLSSRIIATDPVIDATVKAQDSGTTILVPYLQENLYSEAEIMDDSGNLITVNKINKVENKAYVGFYAKSWGEKDIVRQIGSGISAITAAQSLLGRYWAKDMQARLMSSVSGAIADNKANKGGDNVITDAVNEFSYGLAVDALALAGEQMDKFVAVGMHSSTYAKVLKADAASVTTVMDSDLGIERKFYNGMELLVNDLLPIDGGAGTVTTVFFKAGAFVTSNATVETPVELYRDARSGNGGGESQVITRKGYLLTLNGYSFEGANVAGVSPTVAELADATNWSRSVDAKQAPFVALESKI